MNIPRKVQPDHPGHAPQGPAPVVGALAEQKELTRVKIACEAALKVAKKTRAQLKNVLSNGNARPEAGRTGRDLRARLDTLRDKIADV